MSRFDTFQYSAAAYPAAAIPGSIRVTTVNGIVNTWAVTRPVSHPQAPYAPPATVARGSGVAFSPARPTVEMDPSNPQTWQRQYRFTS